MICFFLSNRLIRLLALLIAGCIVNLGLGQRANGQGSFDPIVEPSTHFNEVDGLVAVEAEHFFQQELVDTRAFYLTNSDTVPKFEPDGDPPHVGGASNGAYLEILPDTRRNHGEELRPGRNFTNQPGKAAVVSYKVNFSTPGRYFVWVRAYSSNSEDNGLHVGIDGSWPESGQRLQWCEGKQQWWWESKQRTGRVHCGEPHKIFLDVPTEGIHTIHFSMREDGFEFDKWLMTRDRDFHRPLDAGPVSTSNASDLPKFPLVAVPAVSAPAKAKKTRKKKTAALTADGMVIRATKFSISASNYYVDQKKWLAIDPDKHQSAAATIVLPIPAGVYDVVLQTVGENDGASTFNVTIGDLKLDTYTCPLSTNTFETGEKYHRQWKSLNIKDHETVIVKSTIASTDGQEYSRARWEALAFKPADDATRTQWAEFVRAQTGAAAKKSVKPENVKPENVKSKKAGAQNSDRDFTTSPTHPVSQRPLTGPRQPDGDGTVRVTGELRQWHKISLTMNGPFAHEHDNDPNPFIDIRMETKFTHSDGTTYVVPGYFAADGNAAQSSANSGTQWRTNFAPDRTGLWTFTASIVKGKQAAIDAEAAVEPMFETRGQLVVDASDKPASDFRSAGRLKYVGKRYLQHVGSGKYFLKAGADAPETLLGYADFDGTSARKENVPLKTFTRHLRDWQVGDPTWKDGKGKGLIGAVNYLSGKGCNAFSFLTYNAGGDGDNVWPFVQRDDKLHYDCSKLDQWGIVFDHGTAQGMYLHFKLQETENDDHRGGHKKKKAWTPTSLDGGNLGVQRKLYLREMVARFGHNLALNWNLGEENTQSTRQQIDMSHYISQTDPYDHHVVLHTYPGQQDKIYNRLIGDKSELTGVSLQNSHIKDTHWQTVKWVRASEAAGRPWVVAFDESGSAGHGQCPDLGYAGFDGRDDTGQYIYDQHRVRRQTLWGNVMGGGAGVEYYFGYKFAENDLRCEDWRSRDQSWDYCRICLDFFANNDIPLQDMAPADELVGNPKFSNKKYCLAKSGDVYLVYLPHAGSTQLDLTSAQGQYSVTWFDPATGENIVGEATSTVSGGSAVTLDSGKSDDQDVLAIVRVQSDGR